MSSPTTENGRTNGKQRSGGKSAIFCTIGKAYSFLQITHCRFTFLIRLRAFVIQNLVLILLNNHSVPRWHWPWYSWTISWDNLWSRGNITGNNQVVGIIPCPIRPPTTINPSLKPGDNLSNGLDFNTWRPSRRRFTSRYTHAWTWPRIMTSAAFISLTTIGPARTTLHLKWSLTLSHQHMAFFIR